MKRVSLRLPRMALLGVLCVIAINIPQAGFSQDTSQPKAGVEKSAEKTPEKAATAMQASAPQWMSLIIVRVKPDKGEEYVNFMKNERIPALKKAGVQLREAWATGNFGEAFEFAFVTPITSFAQYDNPQGPVMRALGEEAARAQNLKMAGYVTATHHYALRARPDLSYEGKMDGPPNIGVVTWVRVAPGRNEEWENYLKNEFVPVIKKSNVQGYFVSQVMFGGNANEYITVTLHKNYAEIDQGPPAVRVLGADGAAKLYRKLPAGVVVNQERNVSRFRADLSILPTQTSAK